MQLLVLLILLPSLTTSLSVITEEQAKGINGRDLSSPSLLELYNNLTSIFDYERIQQFVSMKNATDPEARALLQSINAYMRGPKAKRMVSFLWDDIEFVELIAYVHKHGLTQVYEQINKVHAFFGYDPVYPPNKSSSSSLEKVVTYENSLEKPQTTIEFSLLEVKDKDRQNLKEVPEVRHKNSKKTHGEVKVEFHNTSNRFTIFEEPSTAARLIQEFVDFLPMEKLRTFMSWASTKPAFLSLHARASQPSFARHYRDFKKLPEITELQTILTTAGLEFDSLRKIIEVLMKWENHTSVGLYDSQ